MWSLTLVSCMADWLPGLPGRWPAQSYSRFKDFISIEICQWLWGIGQHFPDATNRNGIQMSRDLDHDWNCTIFISEGQCGQTSRWTCGEARKTTRHTAWKIRFFLPLVMLVPWHRNSSWTPTTGGACIEPVGGLPSSKHHSISSRGWKCKQLIHTYYTLKTSSGKCIYIYICVCVCMCVCVISINFMESPWQGWVLGTMMHHASQASHLDDGHRKEGRNLWFLRDNLKVLGVWSCLINTNVESSRSLCQLMDVKFFWVSGKGNKAAPRQSAMTHAASKWTQKENDSVLGCAGCI